MTASLLSHLQALTGPDPIQSHPAYHAGFYDAQEGVPLFESECAPEYAAAWRAYYAVREMLEESKS